MGKILHFGRTGMWLAAAILLAAGGALSAGPAQDTEAVATAAPQPALARYFFNAGQGDHDAAHHVHIYRSGHFIIFHDTDDQAAKATSQLLADTSAQFYRVMTGGGFTLHPLNQSLVCLLFLNKTTFVHYGEAADHQNMSWSGGYYSSRTNRIALYQHQWMPRMVNMTKSQGQADAGKNVNPSAVLAASKSAAVDDLQWGPWSMARTTHEAAHLLAFNSGLQTRGVIYPFWVSEGLATSFETEHPAKPFGPGYANPVRQRGLIEAMHAGSLYPLDQFVAMTQLKTGDPQAVNVAYSQAWGLFDYLFTHRSAALAAYMAKLAHEPMGWRSTFALHEDFVRFFGPTDALAAGWHAWLATLSPGK